MHQSLVFVLWFVYTTPIAVVQPFMFADDGATIEGKFTLSSSCPDGFQLPELSARLAEQIQLESPPVPEGFSDWPRDQQRTWLDQFFAKPEGKRFREKQQQRLRERLQINIHVEQDGRFTIFDVPSGQYTIGANAEKKIDEQTYLFEVLANVQVGEAQEIQLKPLQVNASIVLQPGQVAPNFQVTTIDDQSVQLSQMRGRYVLVYFWGSWSSPCQRWSPQIQKLYRELHEARAVELIGIAVADQREDAQNTIDEHDLGGWQAVATDWNHPAVVAFGVRGVPSLWLIDPEQNILLTDEQVLAGVGSRGATALKEVIQKAIDSQNEGAKK